MMKHVYGFAKPAAETLTLFALTTKGEFQPVPWHKIHHDDKIILFLHPTQSALYELEIPPGKLTELERAAAYILEDKLASPVEDVFVSLSKPKPNGKRTVCVTDVQTLEALSKHPDLHDRDWSLISPFSLLGPGVAVEFEDCAIFNDGKYNFTLDNSLPTDFQEHIVKNFLQREGPEVYGTHLAQSLGQDRTGTQTGLAWCASQIAAKSAKFFDLRQGRYAPKRWSLPEFKDAGRWGIYTGLVALSWVGAQVLNLQASKTLSDVLDQNIIEISQQISPDQPPPQTLSDVGDFRLEKSPSTYLNGMDMIGDIYSALDGLEGISLQEVTFNKSLKQLQAVVIYADFGLDSQIKERLSKTYTVKLGDSRSQGGMVVGNLILEPK